MRGRYGGRYGVAGMVVLVVTLLFLPPNAAFFTDPADTRCWEGSAERWRVLAPAALLPSPLLLPRQPPADRATRSRGH